jgi:uncharacterized LabA/DUF88 family protein
MKPSAVLLIDLENFFISRVQHFNEKGIPQANRPSFAQDFERLITFAQRMAGAPFAVRRAYADYVTLRVGPRELMRQGVEPVQVFRLSGARSGSKNAADMRMAMDATALLASAQHAEQFVLVTGDADFIPVILELKRHGRGVSVIGVTGATNELIQRFVDNFELFEDLIAAEEVEVRSGEQTLTGDGMEKVVVAVRRLLERNRPLRFAAVKPLLSKELDAPFDPGAFGCDTTGDFLRKYETALGVVIRQGQHDSEIDLPGAAPGGSNGNGARVAARPAARSPERPTERPGTKGAAPEPHTPAHYRLLLGGRGRSASGAGPVKVPAVPWSVLDWACDAVVALLAPPSGEPTHTTKLLPKLLAAADGVAIPELVKHLRLFYPILRAGLPVQGADGVYAVPAGSSGEQIRRGVLVYIVYVLATRLTENGVTGEIRADALATVFEPGTALEQVTAEVSVALAQEAPAPALVPAPVPPRIPNADELHTPAGYLKLLKNGGPRGSDTESFKALPVPWASIERVCAAAFPLLCPAAGGGPLSREQLTTRLTETGKELFVENYGQHVRRVLGVLRISGDLPDENGVIALNPEVTSEQVLRDRTLTFLLQLLQLRLEEREVYDPIRPHVFVAALEAGPVTERLLEVVGPVVAWLYRPTEDEREPAAEPVEGTAQFPAPTDSDSRTHEGGDVELVMTGSGLTLAPVSGRAGPAPPVGSSQSTEEPTWDLYAFDGAMPVGAAPVAGYPTGPPPVVAPTDSTPIPSDAPTGRVQSDPDEVILDALPVADFSPEGDPLLPATKVLKPVAPPPPCAEVVPPIDKIVSPLPPEGHPPRPPANPSGFAEGTSPPESA